MDKETIERLMQDPERLEQMLAEAKKTKAIPPAKFESLPNAWLCGGARPPVGETVAVQVHGRTFSMEVLHHVGEFGGIVRGSGVIGYCKFFGMLQSNLPSEILLELERGK